MTKRSVGTIRIPLQVSALVAASIFIAPAVQAQDATGDAGAKSVAVAATGTRELQEVVITAARKRKESVQVTPVAVTAISGQKLERVHATDIKDIGNLVPNLQMIPITGGVDVVGIYLRGFGTSETEPANDPAIPVFIDGVYQTEVVGNELDLFSLSGIEVLRGPQGTLYGKNAPTGAINITTLRPTGDFSGKAQFDYGTFNKTEGRVLVNIPLVDNVLSMNVSILKKYMDNYYYNILNGKDDAGGTNSEAGRLGLLFTPNDRLNWYMTFNYTHADEPQTPQRSIANNVAVPPFQSASPSCVFAGFCNITPTPYTYASVLTNRSPVTSYAVTSNLDYRFDPVTLTSVTGYKIYQLTRYTDFSRVPTPFGLDAGETFNYNQESEELRLSSNKGGGFTFGDRLDWVVGAYYGRVRYYDYQPVFVYGGGLPAVLGSAAAAAGACGIVPISQCGFNVPDNEHQTTESEAVFLHAVYDLTADWNLSFGARKSWDHKDHDTANGFQLGAFTPGVALGTPLFQSAGFHNLSFEAGTQYKIDAEKMVYFRFAQGYRSGGVQGTVATPSPFISLTFQPETVNSFEVGAKTDWLDKRLRVNVDFFNSDYTDLQKNITFFTPQAVSTISNAGSATVRGIELEAIGVPLDDLTVHANVGYLTTTYTEYNGYIAPTIYDQSLNLGQKFPFAPKWTIDLGFDYVYDLQTLGSATFSADWNYKSSFNENDVTIPIAQQSGYGLVNASLRWDDPTNVYSVTFYGNNIFNRHYFVYNVPAVGEIATDGMPATWGMELTAKF